MKVANSIFISKIKYGLQLLGKVRMTKEDVEQGDLGAIQKVQNKMVRLLNGCRLLDKIKTQTLLKNVKMLSVNQINAQIKLTEVWKAVNDPNHPLKIEKLTHVNANCLTRAVKNEDLKEFGKSSIVQSTFLSDAVKFGTTVQQALKTVKQFGQQRRP